MESGADNKWHRTCTIVILIKTKPRNDITTLTVSQPLHRLTVPNSTIVISKQGKGIPVIKPTHPHSSFLVCSFPPLTHSTSLHSTPNQKQTTHLPKFKSHTLFSLSLRLELGFVFSSIMASSSSDPGKSAETSEAAALAVANDQLLLYRGLKKAKKERGCTAKERISKMPPCAAGKRSSIYRGVTRQLASQVLFG